MNIQFVDLLAQYNSIKLEIDQAIENVIKNTAFIGGTFVSTFEKEYADKYGVNHCIGVANGTDALYIVMKALGIGSGDEVITTAMSWISTSETISQTGAKPVFVDVEKDYYTIDPFKIKEKISKNTKAIIPVHLYGQPAQMDQIMDIAKKNNIFVIEDCAQAHFAQFNDQKVGTFGNAATFSFYPGKNLGCYGDGGAIITDDNELAKKMRMYANHGQLKKHDHIIEGINSRLDGIQAAILSVKLNFIDQWNKKRYENAVYYNNLLEDVREIDTPKVREDSEHIFHVYQVRVKERNRLKAYLEKKGVPTAIHYPKALPFLKSYSYLKHTGKDFPIAALYQSEILSLPIYPELTKRQITYIVDIIKSFYSSKKII